jgi:uncharacterized protein
MVLKSFNTEGTMDIHVELLVEPDRIDDAQHIRAQALAKAGLGDGRQVRVRVVRRSIDARARMPRFQLRVAVGGTDTASSVFAPRPLAARGWSWSGPGRAAISRP